MRSTSPILRTERPRITLLGTVGKIRPAIIFYIEKYDIYSYPRRPGMYLTCRFEQNGYTARPVICPVDRQSMIFLLRIIIGIRACIPMGKEQYPVFFFGRIRCNDITCIEHRPVIGPHPKIL